MFSMSIFEDEIKVYKSDNYLIDTLDAVNCDNLRNSLDLHVSRKDGKLEKT